MRDIVVHYVRADAAQVNESDAIVVCRVHQNIRAVEIAMLLAVAAMERLELLTNFLEYCVKLFLPGIALGIFYGNKLCEHLPRNFATDDEIPLFPSKAVESSYDHRRERKIRILCQTWVHAG